MTRHLCFVFFLLVNTMPPTLAYQVCTIFYEMFDESVSFHPGRVLGFRSLHFAFFGNGDQEAIFNLIFLFSTACRKSARIEKQKNPRNAAMATFNVFLGETGYSDTVGSFTSCV
jgi:hypothetical protein